MRRWLILLACVGSLLLLSTDTAAQGRFWVLVNGALRYTGTVLVTGTLTATNVQAAAGNQIGWTGRAQMSSPSDGVIVLTNNAGTDFTRLPLGGATSSFPSIGRSGTTLQALLGDGLDYTTFAAATYRVRTVPFVIGTAPTISSGFGTSPSIVASNGTAAFTINVGTGGSATSGVIGLPAASTGWAVSCANTSANTATVFITKQTAFTTTTATIGNYDAAGAAAAWTASNVLVCQAHAF